MKEFGYACDEVIDFLPGVMYRGIGRSIFSVGRRIRRGVRYRGTGFRADCLASLPFKPGEKRFVGNEEIRPII